MKKISFTLIEVLIALILGLIMAILLPVIFATSSQSNTETTQETLGTVSIQSNMDRGGNWHLPRTATNIINHGNRWYEFTLNDNQWLYHRNIDRIESLALIPKTIVPITKTIVPITKTIVPITKTVQRSD